MCIINYTCPKKMIIIISLLFLCNWEETLCSGEEAECQHWTVITWLMLAENTPVAPLMTNSHFNTRCEILRGNKVMVHPSIWLLLSFSLHSSALPSQNGTMPRTFSGQRVMVTDDPVDYLDLSELDDLSDDQPKVYLVSEEAKGFLQGCLATTFVPTVYTLVFVISVPLNLVAMVMFVHPVRPRKPAVIYMLNLACADLLFGLLLPFKIAYHYHGNDWTYGPVLCRVVTAAFYCNMYCSVLLMTCISVDRFLAVVYPMNSLTWRSPQTASAVCASMWVLALGGVCPLLTSGQTVHLKDLGITTCHDVQDAEKLQAYYLYFFPVYSSVFFFVPLVFTVLCYVRIIRVLAAANVGNRSKKTRAVVMAVIVLVVFVVCFTPTNVILMVHYVQLSYRSSDSLYQAYLLSMCVGSLSCCLDPVLYYFGSSQCQKQVVALLRCRRVALKESSSDTQSTRTSGRRDGGRSCKTETVQTSLGSQYSRLDALSIKT